MDVTAIAAGHAITPVLVKVVHLITKRIGEPSRRFLCATTEQMKWGLLRKIRKSYFSN